MFDVSHMTEEERKGTLKKINDMDKACKIDSDVIFEVMKDTDIFINDLIHINMLKCEVLMDMKKPIYPFTKEDYITICSLPKEEDRRKKLCEILAKKDNENMNEMKQILSEADDKNNIVGGIAVDRLRSLIERIEHLEEEKSGIQSDIRDIFAEAKSSGFDVKAMRAVLKLRKLNVADRDEQDLILDTYRKALEI